MRGRLGARPWLGRRAAGHPAAGRRGAGLLLAGLLAMSGAARAEPVALDRWGSFHVGGREAVISGQPAREVTFTPGGVPAKVDPNGTYLMGGMYAQYMIPANPRGGFPLLMWHGGGLTGVTWETTPDGREGWQHFFLRRGWPVYVSDAVERGRAGWGMIPEQTGGTPVVLPMDNPWERFRIGDGPGSFARQSTNPGVLFPTDPESYRNFVRQNVPRFTTTDALTLEAYLALLDRVGPSVVMVHSQAGQFGWRAAQERPEKVKALVLVEPAAVGDPAKVAALKDIPILMIYGDYIATDARWPAIRGNGLRFAEAVRAAGGTVDWVDLPERGIRGNSHMIMMDRNSDEVAALVQDWLAAKGLWR
ncbi:esterase [Siccirubricoccus sp. KC 17139]|uniref:Esterase n=1 Tax=Siccirubricoccus soli TaxID=2899147 RepID=A0ABT1CZA3_9PROT|nr:esterase [Siccirubricoccus soli]MCO6414979.1 esterase [Siccirubricoccus soli]MCP2681110.1 esterase [Siccirubricoccus soli]